MVDNQKVIDMHYKITNELQWWIKISEYRGNILFHFENESKNKKKYSYIFESVFILQDLKQKYPSLEGIKTNFDFIKKFRQLLQQDEKMKENPNRSFIPHLNIQDDGENIKAIWTVETWGEREVFVFILPPKKLNNKLLLSIITKEISSLNFQLNVCIERIGYLDEKLNKIQKKIFPIDFENSLIRDLNEYSLFLKWGSYQNNNEKKNAKSLKLLYRATRDGDDSIKFHKIIGDAAPTFTIIESTNGRIFGGFTTQTLSNNCELGKSCQIKSAQDQQHKSDKNAFLFSLTDKIKYEQIRKELNTGIDVSEKLICYFSASLNRGDLMIFGGFLKDIGCEYKDKKGYKPVKAELSKMEYFEINDIEVYQVDY